MEQTLVVECSRQSSIEGTTGNNNNPALWTCDCGSGIVLDIGDQIQVHSGYISEKGAEAGKIEVKDRQRSDTIVAEVSNDISYESPLPLYLGGLQPIDWREVYKYAAEFGGNASKTFTINDSEVNIIYSPYKTTNGEFYCSLPRRHIGLSTNASTDADLNPFLTFDCSDGTRIAGINLGAGKTGNIVYNLDGTPYDYGFMKEAWQFCPADYKLVNLNNASFSTDPNAQYTRLKGMIKNDNSRYTIFRATSVYRNTIAAQKYGGNIRANLGGDDSHSTAPQGGEEYQDAYDLRDPAILYEWEQVKEVITLKSRSGFNSTADVATDITEQMNKRGDPIRFTTRFQYTGANVKYIEKEVYQYYESPCYKAYNCATSNWDYDLWTKFKQVHNSTTDQLNDAHNYMSMYQHIGVKRPDLWIQGRKTNASQGFLISNFGDARNQTINTEVLNLGILWTEDNIKKLNDLFDVQGRYPELFTGVEQQGPHNSGTYFDITPGKHRFLHFNKQDEHTNASNYSQGIFSHSPHSSLGYDLYGQDFAVPDPAYGFYHYSNEMATYPLFFDYNEDTVNYSLDDVDFTDGWAGAESDISQLAYGWARKIRIPAAHSVSGLERFYIGIQFTHTGNGVPEFLYNGLTEIADSNLGGLGANGGRRFGWDWHFTAYGNPCIVLYSGFVNTNNIDNFGNNTKNANDETVSYKVAQTADDKTTSRNISAAYHTVLLGADNPALGFNSDEERFFFTNLHMSEKLGNKSDAGKVATSTAAGDGVDANPDADTSVYKVNKQMLGTSYCPNVSPYSASLTIQANQAGQYPAQLMFSNNLEPGVPYDSQGGIFIEQVLVPEELWSSNLMGLLGFQYSQFTNDDTSRQITISDRLNSSNMKFLTTQAPIQVEDLLSYTKNGFGNSIFTLTANPIYIRSADKHIQHTDFEGIYPPITIEFTSGPDSTRITALDYCSKTARPYYAIRSDIIPQNQFFGGNGDYTRSTSPAVGMPIVAIINKTNGYGDFYSAEFNMLSFTNTEKRVITQIKTSIHDPDGSFARVDLSSSVIYKIIKQKQIDLTPLKTMLQSKIKQQVLQGQIAASMLKDPQNQNPNYQYALQSLQM